MFVCQSIIFIGRGIYYRFYRKEGDLSLEQQEYIRRIFRQKGIAEEPTSDSYTKEYIYGNYLPSATISLYLIEI
ncbi:DUF6078 family protein [Bacteroides sp. AN502(2024)]|uniref:DUF6078 family protein n=1 Tax=Bacteroides sp. AN502(2024) TaxID=3160599 RepID=UPI0035121BA9